MNNPPSYVIHILHLRVHKLTPKVIIPFVITLGHWGFGVSLRTGWPDVARVDFTKLLSS